MPMLANVLQNPFFRLHIQLGAKVLDDALAGEYIRPLKQKVGPLKGLAKSV